MALGVRHLTQRVADHRPELPERRGDPLTAGPRVGDPHAIDLVGAIGRAVLNNLMPARRLRLGPRAVKRPMSRCAYKSLRVDRHTYKATVSIDILLTPPISP
ncbi:hypothetical protein ACIRVK_15225 [Streptomyces sp. NPDC101152]|uniref:hypothetical protein n=1 Tax=Streptomyces sp. NPDC101152 TaxID=3366116 RepID=UPI0038212265